MSRCEEAGKPWDAREGEKSNQSLWDEEKETLRAKLEMKGGGALHLEHSNMQTLTFLHDGIW